MTKGKGQDEPSVNILKVVEEDSIRTNTKNEVLMHKEKEIMVSNKKRKLQYLRHVTRGSRCQLLRKKLIV